jgi:hypothetical protein
MDELHGPNVCSADMSNGKASDDAVVDIKQYKRDRDDAAVKALIDAIPGSWERVDDQPATDETPAA